MAMALPALLTIGLGVGSAMVANKVMGGSAKQNMPGPIPLPQPPNPATSTANAEDIIRKKKAAMTQTIYTSPLGVSADAQVVRKTLLGQ